MSSGPDLFVVCKNCHAEVSPYITECPYCGERLRKRAPKLDLRGGEARARRGVRPRLSRLKPGEIPGIRPDRRPYGTMALILGAIGLTVATKAGWIDLFNVVVAGSVSDPWRPFTANFVYIGTGYSFVALVSIALFGWLVERRHGIWAPVFIGICGGAIGMLAAGGLESNAVAMGGNAMALALLCAWAVPDLVRLRRGIEIEGDLLGVAAFAAVLIALPLVVPEADPVAGVVGALVGLVLGLPLARLELARD